MLKTPSEPFKSGRVLVLKFRGKDSPELDRIEFQCLKSNPVVFWQQGDNQHNFTWTKVPRALAVIFLDYLGASGSGTKFPVFFSGARGSLAASLGDAIYQPEHSLHALLSERLTSGEVVSRTRQVFGGKNVHGKEAGDRRITIRSDYLPPDCIEVYWDEIGEGPLINLDDIQFLAEQVRHSMGIALPTVKPACPDHLPNFPELLAEQGAILTAWKGGKTSEEICLLLKAKDVITTVARVQKFCQALVPTPKTKRVPRPAKAKTPEPLTTDPAPPLHPPVADATPPTPQSPKVALSPRIPPIQPEQFFVFTNGKTWSGEEGLIRFGSDEADQWKIKDSYEGVLILGAPGSGKTSGSGNLFAENFVGAGFGGLVLTAKPGEAQRWLDLCERCGRGGDAIVINADGPSLNILAYESQRPSVGLGLANNLVGLFRILIETVSRSSSQSTNDEFWKNATDQLMRSLFEVFILAGETLTLDGLQQFLNYAPQKPLANPEQDWLQMPVFGSILSRASQTNTPKEERVYERVLGYWTRDFPRFPDRARSSIILGFSGMADILGGRGIHELVCSETTLTPEAILDGNIVIVDLPIKDFCQGGLLVQAAWKHLFQTMVERRAVADTDAHRYPMFQWDHKIEGPVEHRPMPGSGDRRRPVFLWEDEGQFFFSPHDINFQATARESRVAHVVISQNLHNFFQLGHNHHAVEGVFSLMNTQVFHANGDHDTNQWASAKIGKETKTHFNFSTSPEPQPGFWDLLKLTQTKTSTSTTRVLEEIVRPEEFSKLKKGGDGTCEAILLWVSHQFAANGGRPFMKLTFNQNKL